MNVREMHIEIDQATQLVAANRSRKWYPEEKDLVLNRIVERYIQSFLRPKKDQAGNFTGGFQLDQVNTEDIKSLMVLNYALQPYITAGDANTYKCYLPADCKYMISDSSITKLLCGEVPTTTTDTLYINGLRQDRTAKVSAPFYVTNVVNMGTGITCTIPTDLPYSHEYVGYQDKKDIAFLIPWILWKTGLRWESFDDVYKPAHYLKVTSVPPAGTFSVIVDGVTYTTVTAETKLLARHTNSGSLSWPNRLTASDIIANVKVSAFHTTKASSPISELSGDILWVYRDNSFIVSGVMISYIRKPRPISLSLNSDCDLNETAHRKICDMAVEYLQGRAKDVQGKQISEEDLIKRVIL